MKNALLPFLICAAVIQLFGQDPIVFGPGEIIHRDSIYRPHHIISHDFDQDGDMDMIMDKSMSSLTDYHTGILYCENDGAGNFTVADIVDLPDLSYFSPISLLSGDLDNDGDFDVIADVSFIANDGSRALLLYEQVSPGDFELTRAVTIEAGLGQLKLADFDFDNDLDLMIVNWRDHEIYWNLNDGTGIFSLHDTISLNETYRAIYSDIDEDGDMDILNARYGVIYWHENLDGETSFNTHILYDAPNASIISITDLDTNGTNDIVIRSSSDQVACLYGNGTDSFQISNWSLDIQLSQSVTIHDVNADGLPDIFGEDYDIDQLIWYENSGSGFDTTKNVAYSGDNFYFTSFRFADLDQDGFDDLYAIDESLPEWFAGDGTGMLSDPQVITGNSVVTGPVSLMDIDQDGFRDVIMIRSIETLYNANYSLQSYLNNGNGSFGSIQDMGINSELSYSTSYPILLQGDLDGDNDDDIVSIVYDTSSIGSSGLSDLYWHENLSNDAFGPQQFIGKLGAEQKLALGDIDGDSDLDIAVLHSHNEPAPPPGTLPQGLLWLENVNTQFLQSHFLTEILPVGPIKIADVDGDLDADIALIDEWGLIADTNRAKLVVYDNDGIQNFEQKVIRSNWPEGASYWEFYSPELLDVDEDGDEDLIGLAAIYVFGNSYLGLIWIENTGLGSSWNTSIIDLHAENSYPSFFLGDIEGDTDKDIFWQDYFTGDLIYYANEEAGEFAMAQTILRLGLGPQNIKTADMDNDGKTDLVIGPDQHGNTYLYRNLISAQNIIRTQVFYDRNENGVMDDDDFGMENQVITVLPGNQLLLTDESGFAYFFGELGFAYNVAWESTDGWELTSDTSDYNVALPDDPDNIYRFGVFPDEVIHFVQPSITGVPTTCITPSIYFFTYSNEGTVIENGYAEFILDTSAVYLAALPEPDYISGDTLQWEFEDLLPGQSADISIAFNVEDIEVIGDTLRFTGNTYVEDLSGSVTDSFSSKYGTIFLCSYDPNDKLVQPAGIGNDALTLWDETLIYTIRFQNTGNFTAFNITLRDTIDAHLDLSTFRVLHHSHPMSTSIDAVSREVKFFFSNIQLPDSLSDPLGSNGFVTYSIRPVEGLEEATPVQNTAHIFFDLNPAITTNTVINTLVETIGTEIPTTVIELEGSTISASLYPNPSRDHSYLLLETPVEFRYDLELIDFAGRQIQIWPDRESGLISISTENISPGVYLVNIRKHGDQKILGSLKLVRQ